MSVSKSTPYAGPFPERLLGRNPFQYKYLRQDRQIPAGRMVRIFCHVLIWMLSANPDTSTIYVELARERTVWRFCHAGGFAGCGRGRSPVPSPVCCPRTRSLMNSFIRTPLVAVLAALLLAPSGGARTNGLE